MLVNNRTQVIRKIKKVAVEFLPDAPLAVHEHLLKITSRESLYGFGAGIHICPPTPLNFSTNEDIL